ncbi:MAG: hypothetical protein JKY86_06420 [Gammaproteobacteria bacterium]|nr:hypothetical protein [Gammaproteobacteria bacterium]
MTSSEEKDLANRLREAIAKSRGYADFFEWRPNRDLEEQGVVMALSESLEKDDMTPYTGIISRGRNNDPPDCEAQNELGLRTAVEVTELVYGKAIESLKSGGEYFWTEWTKDSFLDSIFKLITRKDSRFVSLKGAPYPGGYDLIIYTDEPELNFLTVSRFLENATLPITENLSNIFLLLSYEPEYEKCPYIQIAAGR